MSDSKALSFVPVALAFLGLFACGAMLTTSDAETVPEIEVALGAAAEMADDSSPADPSAAPLVAQKPTLPGTPNWKPLFDGESLKGWKSTEFGGEGPVAVEDGAIVLSFGSNMTGITSTADIPRNNYEVEFLANRVDGNDFFCGLTFPVKESYLSLILGGWGGGVCGLSSIDGFDASENQTTHFRTFRKGEWYKVRLRVTDKEIVAWVDGERIIEQELEDHKLSIRIEVELSCPFGFSTWQTTGAIKDIKIRELNPAEIPAEG